MLTKTDLIMIPSDTSASRVRDLASRWAEKMGTSWETWGIQAASDTVLMYSRGHGITQEWMRTDYTQTAYTIKEAEILLMHPSSKVAWFEDVLNDTASTGCVACEFVNVSFMGRKMVCRICDKEET